MRDLIAVVVITLSSMTACSSAISAETFPCEPVVVSSQLMDLE